MEQVETKRQKKYGIMSFGFAGSLQMFERIIRMCGCCVR